jgi:hypothetical protein
VNDYVVYVGSTENNVFKKICPRVWEISKSSTRYKKYFKDVFRDSMQHPTRTLDLLDIQAPRAASTRCSTGVVLRGTSALQIIMNSK